MRSRSKIHDPEDNQDECLDIEDREDEEFKGKIYFFILLCSILYFVLFKSQIIIYF